MEINTRRSCELFAKEVFVSGCQALSACVLSEPLFSYFLVPVEQDETPRGGTRPTTACITVGRCTHTRRLGLTKIAVDTYFKARDQSVAFTLRDLRYLL
jgi:hypothetical protein